MVRRAQSRFQTSNSQTPHLSDALQHSQAEQPVQAELSGKRGEQGEDSGAKHTQTQEDTPPVVTGQVAPQELCAQVAEEEGSQQPALSLRVPRILWDLG